MPPLPPPPAPARRPPPHPRWPCCPLSPPPRRGPRPAAAPLPRPAPPTPAAPTAAPRAAPPAAAEPAPAPATAEARALDDGSPWLHLDTTEWVIAGVGAASLVSAVIFNVGARAAMSDCRRLADNNNIVGARSACDRARP